MDFTMCNVNLTIIFEVTLISFAVFALREKYVVFWYTNLQLNSERSHYLMWLKSLCSWVKARQRWVKARQVTVDEMFHLSLPRSSFIIKPLRLYSLIVSYKLQFLKVHCKRFLLRYAVCSTGNKMRNEYRTVSR